ncbi:39S ribosomal protein L44, mitochondrial [Ctenocephalides felis]|uniref:39S ribosomal protein L44, mitochondrial n=1 Tax=Ctenocephalides felis TaxID=7515 RepID=UPI000E6E18D0|nr:39S ribosomal protein L44, mitochondrial [Ctenocephalides felis]
MFMRECCKVLNISNKQIFNSIQATRSIKRWVSPTLRELKRRKDKMGPEPVARRSSFIDWNFNAELYAFSKRLNENFNLTLLQQAFTQRSYVIQEEMKQIEVGIEKPVLEVKDNRLLIISGEELISEYVEKFLLQSLPKLPKDGINAIKSYLTSEEVLANVSSHLGTKEIILSAEYPAENKSLSDTLKAIVGALNESSGTFRAYEFIRDFICTQLNGIDVNELWEIDDPMKMLSELCKDQGEIEPRLIGESAPHTILATFHVGIYLNKKLIGTGFGESIFIAKHQAAMDALRQIFGTTEHMKPFNFSLPVHDQLDDKMERKNM